MGRQCLHLVAVAIPLWWPPWEDNACTWLLLQYHCGGLLGKTMPAPGCCCNTTVVASLGRQCLHLVAVAIPLWWPPWEDNACIWLRLQYHCGGLLGKTMPASGCGC